jgi:L-asparagine oxygenase
MKIQLTENDIHILQIIAKKIQNDPYKNPDLFCNEIKNLLLEIPDNLKNIFINFKNNGSETGFLLINIPFSDDDRLILTPDSNEQYIGGTTEIAKIQAILMSIMGNMISYEAEGCGNLFQDIIPVKSMSNNQTSTGSNFELEIHTEQAFSKLRPDIISLACLRGDINAFTYVLPVQYILSNMNEDEIELLKQPLWKTGVDLSFKLNNDDFIEGDIRGPFSIIQGNEKNPNLIFDQDLMFGITDQSQNILKKIVNIYYKYRLSHNLISGDIIFIDNNRAVHGRSQFQPKFDGFDRFLIRTFLVFDYERVKQTCNKKDYMISAIYS